MKLLYLVLHSTSCCVIENFLNAFNFSVGLKSQVQAQGGMSLGEEDKVYKVQMMTANEAKCACSTVCVLHWEEGIWLLCLEFHFFPFLLFEIIKISFKRINHSLKLGHFVRVWSLSMILLAEASTAQVQAVTCRHELNINPLLLCLSCSQQKVLQSYWVNHLVKVYFGLPLIPTLSDLLFEYHTFLENLKWLEIFSVFCTTSMLWHRI